MVPSLLLIFTLIMPGNEEARSAVPALTGTLWKLEAFADSAGRESVAAAGAMMRLTVPGSPVSVHGQDTLRHPLTDDRGSVEGFAGCNRFHGSCFLRDSSLSFGRVVTTMMDCPMMEVEYRLLDVLNRTTGYRITDRKLQLLEGDRPIAHFQADSDTTGDDTR